MSASLSRAAAALLRWGRGAGGGVLPRAGVRAASSGGQAEQLDALVKKDKVVVFLKGTPEQPQCGFSNAVVQILRLHGVRDYAAYNVLEDPELRQGQARGTWRRGRGELEQISRSIKDYSNWPTIPQVYLNGEFVGGCDILLQMHQNGDLVEELKKLGIRSALIDEKDQDSK
uniref:glutaredoxin-related protein 5, mitochondrial isoform 2 n=1 Tax=Rattus norvegicus TaxID=10116 RepID=UPI0030FEF0E1